ncbi:phosphatidylinositol phosphate synthase [Corynebacterium doosanense]|uniref:Phosphatidylinositol phosphate synthase n=1 Tax=Corynebacterium doosanense CAU 212 = DSM 45436 TaxID=558173 RepID=A0A097IGH4_9CORY|nr:CDP-alcohol phosphatidyltransferase family protein [Corynebacterium doosanense]AIT61219.1 phosphatidylglycerophosphate synthase [Corynebacterium doosanense CAU 212 = DSM 45436]
MLSVHGRRPAAVVVEPVARGLLKIGLTPNAITVLSSAISVALVVILIPAGHLVWAAILIGLFTAVDMVDGTMARLRGGGTKFGATLDATCDRITDGALFAAITWWLVYTHDAHPSLVAATLGVLISSQVISYIKARGEASGFQVVGGLIERPERLIIALVGLGLEGFGVPYALDAAIWLLLAGSVFTVFERFRMAYNSPHANDFIAPPTGSKEAGEKK